MLSMEFLFASGIGLVTAAGVYLLLRARSFPVVLGLTLLGYAVNLFIFATGRLWTNAAPIVGHSPGMADPLPQALVLTAIVIGFATTGFVIEMALRGRHEQGSDHVDGVPQAGAGEPAGDGPGDGPGDGSRAEPGAAPGRGPDAETGRLP